MSGLSLSFLSSFFSESAAYPLVISLLSGVGKPDLLQIITTDSGPIITHCSARLTSSFMDSWVKASEDDAGILARAPLTREDPAQFERLWRVNCLGLLLGLHHMAGTACSASESIPGGRVTILRMRAGGDQDQSCGGYQPARDHCVHRFAVSICRRQPDDHDCISLFARSRSNSAIKPLASAAVISSPCSGPK